MNDFLTKLASTVPSARSSDHLTLLGKRAANAYASGETGSLTDAVRKVVEDEDLTRDQVSRIAELANQETWKSRFVESGDRDAQFAPADALAVIGEMSAKPEGVSVRSFEELDYLNDVPNQNPPDDLNLAELFGVSPDSPEYEALNPVHREQVAVEKTASALDDARYGTDNAAHVLATAGEEFYQQVRRAHLDEECGFLQIAKAVGMVFEDHAFARDTMQKVAARLEKEGIRFKEKVELQKVAHPLVVNMEHPLIQAASNLEHAAYSYYAANETLEKLSADLRTASQALRSKLKATR